MTEQDFILAPTTVQVRLALEPVRNAFNTLMLLNFHDTRSGLSEWVERTVAEMPPDLLHQNKVLSSIYFALQPSKHWASFSDYIDHLEAEPGTTLYQRYSEMYSKHYPEFSPAILEDKARYIAYIQQQYAKHDEYCNTDMYSAFYDLLVEPDQLKAALVAHLRTMWERWLKADWERCLPVLEESIMTFRQLDFSDLTALEAARAITGRDLSSFWESADKIKEVVFIPSAHIGPYISRFDHRGVAYVLFGARVAEGVRTPSTALSRSELLVQLNALADDTRLSILELCNRHGELCAQDIITKLELSQSSASRHLRQLAASGYLIERRRDAAKCYSLNQGRIEETSLAIRLFLGRHAT